MYRNSYDNNELYQVTIHKLVKTVLKMKIQISYLSKQLEEKKKRNNNYSATENDLFAMIDELQKYNKVVNNLANIVHKDTKNDNIKKDNKYLDFDLNEDYQTNNIPIDEDEVLSKQDSTESEGTEGRSEGGYFKLVLKDGNQFFENYDPSNNIKRKIHTFFVGSDLLVSYKKPLSGNWIFYKDKWYRETNGFSYPRFPTIINLLTARGNWRLLSLQEALNINNIDYVVSDGTNILAEKAKIAETLDLFPSDEKDLFRQKNNTYKLLPDIVPPAVSIIADNGVLKMKDINENPHIKSLASFNGKPVIIKPNDSYKGRGIISINSFNDKDTNIIVKHMNDPANRNYVGWTIALFALSKPYVFPPNSNLEIAYKEAYNFTKGMTQYIDENGTSQTKPMETWDQFKGIGFITRPRLYVVISKDYSTNESTIYYYKKMHIFTCTKGYSNDVNDGPAVIVNRRETEYNFFNNKLLQGQKWIDINGIQQDYPTWETGWGKFLSVATDEYLNSVWPGQQDDVYNELDKFSREILEKIKDYIFCKNACSKDKICYRIYGIDLVIAEDNNKPKIYLIEINTSPGIKGYFFLDKYTDLNAKLPGGLLGGSNTDFFIPDFYNEIIYNIVDPIFKPEHFVTFSYDSNKGFFYNTYPSLQKYPKQNLIKVGTVKSTKEFRTYFLDRKNINLYPFIKNSLEALGLYNGKDACSVHNNFLYDSNIQKHIYPFQFFTYNKLLPLFKRPDYRPDYCIYSERRLVCTSNKKIKNVYVIQDKNSQFMYPLLYYYPIVNIDNYIQINPDNKALFVDAFDEREFQLTIKTTEHNSTVMTTGLLSFYCYIGIKNNEIKMLISDYGFFVYDYTDSTEKIRNVNKIMNILKLDVDTFFNTFVRSYDDPILGLNTPVILKAFHDTLTDLSNYIKNNLHNNTKYYNETTFIPLRFVFMIDKTGKPIFAGISATPYFKLLEKLLNSKKDIPTTQYFSEIFNYIMNNIQPKLHSFLTVDVDTLDVALNDIIMKMEMMKCNPDTVALKKFLIENKQDIIKLSKLIFISGISEINRQNYSDKIDKIRNLRNQIKYKLAF